MTFVNLYYKRTAGTAKACYICNKPTVIVLATIDTVDFLYTCPIHLTDRGFATRVQEPEQEPTSPSISQKEIAKLKQEWEEKQRQKKVKVTEKESQVDGDRKGGTEADGKPTDGESKTDGCGEKKPDNSIPTAPQSESETPASKPTHERYVLHRNIFSLRTAEHRRRRQAAQTKDLAPRLPGAPSSLP